MKKIKIAQIGAGHDHATAAFMTLKNLSDIYEIVGYAVVDEDCENLERLSYEGNKQVYDDAKRMSVEEILNYPDLDAVCVETEDRALTKYALMAAKKGLNIYMDKPGGINQAEFDELIDTAKEKNIVFQTGYMYRFNPEVLKLKEKIKNGELGEIYAIEAQMNCIHQPDKRDWLKNYPGGMLYYLGCHLIDLVYDILGEPDEVIPLSMPIGTDGVVGEDFGMAVFKYKNGVSFVKSTAVETGGFERRQFVVCGTRKTIELKPFEWLDENYKGNLVQPQRTKVRIAESENWNTEATCYVSELFGRYDAMYRAFADYVNGKKENPFGYEYERNLHKLILKACRGERK